MDLKKLGFEIGVGGYGLNDEYMADIKVIGITDCIIACQASDKPTAELLRKYVLDVLQRAKTAATINMGRLYMHVPEGSDMAITYKGQHYPLLDLLAKADTLQAEVDQLRQQLHDHDRRRDASMELARTLAEGQPTHSLTVAEIPKHADYFEPAGCPECFGFEHLDCICHDEPKPCMDIDGANLGLDSGNAPA